MKLLMTTNCPRSRSRLSMMMLRLGLKKTYIPYKCSVSLSLCLSVCHILHLCLNLFSCLFVTSWPNASPSAFCLLPAFHLCPVPAHVYFILSLPVPLELRSMLTAICMEPSRRSAWLPGTGEGQMRLLYLLSTILPFSFHFALLLLFAWNKSFGFNVILIRHSPEATKWFKSPTNWPFSLSVFNSEKLLLPNATGPWLNAFS